MVLLFSSLPNTVLVKLPSGETKKTIKASQIEVTKLPKPTTSGAQKPGKPDQKADKKEVCIQICKLTCTMKFSIRC